MNSWTYTYEDKQSTFNRYAKIVIMQWGAKEIVISLPMGYIHNNRTYKTVKGAQRWVEKNFPHFQLTETRIRQEF